MGRTLSMYVLISNFSDVTFGKRLLERKIQHLNCVYVRSLLLQCLFCVELLTIIVFACSGRMLLCSSSVSRYFFHHSSDKQFSYCSRY